MSEIKTFIGKCIDKWLYFKLCYSTATQLFSVGIGIFERLALIMIFLKVYNIPQTAIIFILICFIPVLYIFGHILLNNPHINLIRKEHTLINKYNPQMQQLLKNTKGKSKKKHTPEDN